MLEKVRINVLILRILLTMIKSKMAANAEQPNQIVISKMRRHESENAHRIWA